MSSLSGSETSDRLQLNGRGGDDSARIGSGASNLIGVGVDLGPASPDDDRRNAPRDIWPSRFGLGPHH